MATSNLTADAGEFHPIANHWPLLADDELQRLADDIKAHGLLNPIWREQGWPDRRRPQSLARVSAGWGRVPIADL